jgi:hypothetical protein
MSMQKDHIGFKLGFRCLRVFRREFNKVVSPANVNAYFINSSEDRVERVGSEIESSDNGASDAAADVGSEYFGPEFHPPIIDPKASARNTASGSSVQEYQEFSEAVAKLCRGVVMGFRIIPDFQFTVDKEPRRIVQAKPAVVCHAQL